VSSLPYPQNAAWSLSQALCSESPLSLGPPGGSARLPITQEYTPSTLCRFCNVAFFHPSATSVLAFCIPFMMKCTLLVRVAVFVLVFVPCQGAAQGLPFEDCKL